VSLTCTSGNAIEQNRLIDLNSLSNTPHFWIWKAIYLYIMEKGKPIKRSNELAPLSREHHDGLLFAWKLKQGLINGTPPELLVNYTRWYWSTHLASHFKNEEQVLVKFLPADNPLVDQMFRDHVQIRQLITSLDNAPDTKLLQSLSEIINDHIRFEERKLFPFIEQVLTPEQLSEIYNELPKDNSCDIGPAAAGWKDEFWLKKK
jgi:hemerythrin-like domain-containing protein